MSESEINLVITAFKELVTAGALIYGLYLGTKSLRKLLLDDVVKGKMQRLLEANANVEKLTHTIIAELDSIESMNPLPTEYDYNYLKSKARNINDAALGGSKEINTLCYLFMRSIQGAFPDKLNEGSIRSPNYYEMLFNFALLANNFASNLIPIPEKIKTVPFSTGQRKLRGIKIKEEYLRLDRQEFGIDINVDKILFLRFVNMLIGTNSHFFYLRNFFRTTRDNTSLLLLLYYNKLYLPLSLAITDILFMPDPSLKLIKYSCITETSIDRVEKEYIYAYYSNLDNVHCILDQKLPGKILPINDSFGVEKFSITSQAEEIVLLEPETLRMKIPMNIAKGLYSLVKEKVQKHLKRYYS